MSYVYLLFALAIGSASLWSGLKILKSRAKVKSWPQTIGKMLERNTQLINIPRGWRLSVKYTYSVAGRSYTGDRVYEVGNFVIPIGLFNKEFADNAGILTKKINEAKLKQGFPDQIPVFYDPKNPEKSCLRLQAVGWAWFTVIAGILILSWVVLTILGGML